MIAIKISRAIKLGRIQYPAKNSSSDLWPQRQQQRVKWGRSNVKFNIGNTGGQAYTQLVISYFIY